jgi:para-nitrobenzyl esterase
MMYGYSLYKNIPYAKPPTGNLRFMEPVAYGTWGDTLDGTEFGPSCIQIPASITYKYLPTCPVEYPPP